jgi:Ca-activated chloride channel homolog
LTSGSSKAPARISGMAGVRETCPRAQRWRRDDLRVSRLAKFFVACAALALCGAAQESNPSSAQTIHVNVDRVNVGVVVMDSKGKFVEGLQRENFRVFDNNAPQPITEFASLETPAQVLMVVEAGPAVYLLRDVHLFVADALLGGLSAGDSIAIASYNEAPSPILNFTTDKRAGQAALDQIAFNLGYGALNLSSSLNTILDWLAPIPGKKTVVLVTTGVDTSPQAAMQSAFARLQASDVQVLAVSMNGPIRSAKDAGKGKYQQTIQAFGEADAWLSTLAEATGGRAFFPENAKAFQETYRIIAEIVRHEYSLAFAPPSADGAIHSIDVKVESTTKSPGDKPVDYRVDHRKAYQAPKP